MWGVIRDSRVFGLNKSSPTPGRHRPGTKHNFSFHLDLNESVKKAASIKLAAFPFAHQYQTNSL